MSWEKHFALPQRVREKKGDKKRARNRSAGELDRHQLICKSATDALAGVDGHAARQLFARRRPAEAAGRKRIAWELEQKQRLEHTGRATASCRASGASLPVGRRGARSAPRSTRWPQRHSPQTPAVCAGPPCGRRRVPLLSRTARSRLFATSPSLSHYNISSKSNNSVI